MFVGVDIGRTKILVSVSDEKRNVISSKRIDTPTTFKKGLQAIFSLIREQVKKEPITAIGLSAPGPINRKRGKILNPPHFPGWENAPIVSLLEKEYKAKIFFNNDANAFALAEYRFGKYKKIKNLLYLTLSSGMGAGIIVDGKLLQGLSDTAGEIGHIVLDIDGPECPCGQRGCWEVYCGGLNLANMIQEKILHEKICTGMVKEAGDIKKITVIHLLEAVRKEDEFALAVWQNFIDRLAQGIGILVMSFNPEVVLLGTIAIHAKELLMTPLKKALLEYAWKRTLTACKIEPSIIDPALAPLALI